MLLPCGPPPEREDDWEYSRKEKDVNGSDLLCLQELIICDADNMHWILPLMSRTSWNF